MKIKQIIIVIAIALCVYNLNGAIKANAAVKDSSFRIIIESGAGYGYLIDTLIQKGAARGGMSWFCRIMWKPDHLLSIGLEVGWVHIADQTTKKVPTLFGITDIDAILRAVPTMLVFDMDLWGFDLYTGLGWYYTFASIRALNEEVTSSQWTVGFYLSLAYKRTIWDKLKAGVDLKWCSVGELGKTILSGQLFLSYCLFEW